MKQYFMMLMVVGSFLFISLLNGQQSPEANLVPNWSFEEYEKCPKTHTVQNLSHELIPNWSYPTRTAPDYFNRCSENSEVGVPENFAGVSEPKTGDGYIGFILSGSEVEYREYVQGRLKENLKPNTKYCVRFSYRLASMSKFVVDQLSVYFTDRPVENKSTKALGVDTKLNNQSGLFLDNVKEWQEICHLYEATGNESHFIIGNFKDYQHTNYVVTDKNVQNQRGKEYAYYFFDDIIIEELDNCLKCPCVNHDLEAVIIDTSYTGGFNPLTGRIDKKKDDGEISIAVSGGTPPYTINWSNGQQGKNLSNLSAGKYQFTVKDQNNCIQTGKVHFKAPKIKKPADESQFETIQEGSAIILNNIFFETNKTKLLPASFKELDRVVQFINEHNISKIEISGHTDSDGSESYNQKLSEGRAKAVVEYLKEKGISEKRLTYVGHGENKPIDTNKTDEGKARNRRVEFLVVKR